MPAIRVDPRAAVLVLVAGHARRGLLVVRPVGLRSRVRVLGVLCFALRARRLHEEHQRLRVTVRPGPIVTEGVH